ncbi:PAS domain-containing protein [Halovenus sp. WSH3]|uniref:PAS domain-containing protein n=1 Tax=Halovenus carboxidivorans TaxID=2692199 RepID=A0A6B0T450_9EURY|nr:PAS domain-containing protein [Halovenus carboxidivorans]MXR50946.1 PAS domain-containing protein [Halovenus carboxidivorans]
MRLRESSLSVVLFGAVLFSFATAYHLFEIFTINSVLPPIVAWLMDGGLAVGVIVLGWRLTEAEFSAAESETTVRWMLVGAVAGGALIGMTFVVRLVEGRTLSEPVFPLLVGINGGALLATFAGYYAARSEAAARRFEGIFNNTYQLTGLLANDGTIVEANETALSFGGLAREDVVGKKLWETYWVEPYTESQQIIEAAVTDACEGELFRDQIKIRGETGSAIIDFSVRPMYDDSGEVVQLIVEGRDITKIQRQKEYLSVLHRYLRHNLRNDLNTIQGYAVLLLEKLEAEPHTERARTIHQTATELSHSSELVKQVSEVTGEESTDVYPQELARLVNRGCDQASIATSRFSVDVPSGQTVYVDDRIHLMFEEFLNALGDHLEDDGEIRITHGQGDEQVHLEISCRGFTIPPAELSAFDSVNERTSTHHPDGIRFWLLKSVVTECGGRITYDTRSGEGTNITLTFVDGSKEMEVTVPPVQQTAG